MVAHALGVVLASASHSYILNFYADRNKSTEEEEEIVIEEETTPEDEYASAL